MKAVFLFLVFLFLSCKNFHIMNVPQFVTDDGKVYYLRSFQTQQTSTLAAGQTIRPLLAIYQDSSSATVYRAWEPVLYNQVKKIIPVYFSQFATQSPNNPRTVYRYSTPYFIQDAVPYGRNTFQIKMSPYCELIDSTVSFYNPTADFTTVAFSGNIICKHYEDILFTSTDFLDIIAPNSTIRGIQFYPTYNAAAYMAQNIGALPPTGAVLNDYVNCSLIGYQPGWGGNTDITVYSEFLYFELQE